MESFWWLWGNEEVDRGRSGSPVAAPGMEDALTPTAAARAARDDDGSSTNLSSTSPERSYGREEREEEGRGGVEEVVGSSGSRAVRGGGEEVEISLSPSLMSITLPFGPEDGGKHSSFRVDARKFQVRGRNYLRDRKKISSAPSLLRLVHVEVFKCKKKVFQIAMQRGSLLRAARNAGDKRRYLVVAYQTPADGTHLVLYFAASESELSSAPAGVRRLWDRMWAGEPGSNVDKFRTERWKVIPSIVSDVWVVQSYVGDKPALLASKLTHQWTKSEELNALEIDCDVDSSSAASFLVGLLHTYSSSLVIDLAFVLEGRDESELPEHVLGSVRLSCINLENVRRIPPDSYGSWDTESSSSSSAAARGGGSTRK